MTGKGLVCFCQAKKDKDKHQSSNYNSTVVVGRIKEIFTHSSVAEVLNPAVEVGGLPHQAGQVALDGCVEGRPGPRGG